jgi:hypothetical protein
LGWREVGPPFDIDTFPSGVEQFAQAGAGQEQQAHDVLELGAFGSDTAAAPASSADRKRSGRC